MITDSQLNGYAERVLFFMQNSSDVRTIHLQLLAHTVKNDHIIERFLSKLDLYDKVRVMYYTYFLSKGYKPDDIFILLDKIYIYTVEDYDEKSYVDHECNKCYGVGYVECDSCDGSSRETCSTCDGDTTVDCDNCNGSGTEKCGYCDGKGSETEEDDEGDETEVECVRCDGRGTEECGYCGGSGNFECHSCNGKGFEDCSRCEGSASESCDYCSGNGEVQSDEEYYTSHYTTYRTTLDNLIFSFEEPMEDEDRIDELEYEMTLSSRMGNSDILVSDIDSEYDTDDWDRVVVVINAEELTESSGRNYSIF